MVKILVRGGSSRVLDVRGKITPSRVGPPGWSRPSNSFYSPGPSVWEFLVLRLAIVCQGLRTRNSEIGCFNGIWIVLGKHPRNPNLHVTCHIAKYRHFGSCHVILPHLRLAGAGRLIFRVAEGKGCGSPLAKIMGLYSSGTLLGKILEPNGSNQHFKCMSHIRSAWPTQKSWQVCWNQ